MKSNPSPWPCRIFEPANMEERKERLPQSVYSDPRNPSSCSLTFIPSYCRVAAPGTSALYRVENPPRPVLEEVGNIAYSVAVRQQIPSAGTITVVVEPRPKDQVRSSTKEYAGRVH